MLPGFYINLTSTTPQKALLDLVWTSGSSGAVPSALTTSAEVASVVHGATGVYVVTLKGVPYRLNVFKESIQQASYSKTGACKVRITATDLAAKTITLLVVDGDGDAVEPTTNDIIRLGFEFQLSPN